MSSYVFIQCSNILKKTLSSVRLIIVLYVHYNLDPNRKVNLKEAFCGVIFATFGWQIVSLGFSYYVSTLGNFSATYGSLGTVIVLMLWFYLSGIIIMLGGVINSVLIKRHNEEESLATEYQI